MSEVKYLLDEHVADRLRSAIQQHHPEIVMVRIGGLDVPVTGTPDPELLKWCEVNGFAIVTNDHSTMAAHAVDHLEAGGHTWGVFILRTAFSLREIAESLMQIALASQAEEWIDQVEYVPF